jgi:hypothetical protein
MRVVEEGRDAAAANALDEPWLVPLVDEREIDAVERLVEGELGPVRRTRQLREDPGELAQRLLPVLTHEVLQAPRVPRLEDHDLVPTCE